MDAENLPKKVQYIRKPQAGATRNDCGNTSCFNRNRENIKPSVIAGFLYHIGLKCRPTAVISASLHQSARLNPHPQRHLSVRCCPLRQRHLHQQQRLRHRLYARLYLCHRFEHRTRACTHDRAAYGGFQILPVAAPIAAPATAPAAVLSIAIPEVEKEGC